jgi:hypothetical protein
MNHDVGIRKYILTDPQRTSLDFNFRILNQKEQMIHQQSIDGLTPHPSVIDRSGG